MPPWLPEPQALKFADERRLSAEQIALIKSGLSKACRKAARRTYRLSRSS